MNKLRQRGKGAGGVCEILTKAIKAHYTHAEREQVGGDVLSQESGR